MSLKSCKFLPDCNYQYVSGNVTKCANIRSEHFKMACSKRCTEAFATELRHNCGICFSSGPVDVGVVTMPNGKMAYICEMCMCQRNIAKIFEEANKEDEFEERRVS